MPTKAGDLHLETSQLYDHIVAAREPLDRRTPIVEDFLVAARVGADAQGPAEVVQDDRGIVEALRQVSQFVELGMEEPRIEGQPMTPQLRKPFSKSGEGE